MEEKSKNLFSILWRRRRTFWFSLFFILIAGIIISGQPFFSNVWGWLKFFSPKAEEASALNKLNNYGFESSAEPGTSWNAAGSTVPTENSFVRIATSSAEGSYSFYVMWTGTSGNQDVNRSLSQTYSPTVTRNAIARIRYKRFCGGATNPDSASLYLYMGSGGVTTTLFTKANANNACGASDKDTTWQTSAWSATTTLIAGSDYLLSVNWTARLDSGEFYGAVIDYIEFNVAPTGLSASAPTATSSAYLSWTASTGDPSIDGTTPYHIYRGLASTTLSYYANATTTSANFTDNNTTGNTTYYYAVADVDTAGVESPTSSVASVLTRPGKPATPTYSGVSGTSITVNWDAPSGGATSYKIERATTTPGTWDQVATGQTSPWADSTVECSNTYYYRVRGTNATGDSEYSEYSSQATEDCPPPPPPPSGGQVKSATKSGLVGHWTMDRTDVTATKVFDKSGNNNHGTPIGFWSGQTPTSTAGKIGQAITFDGVNGYINAGNGGVLNPTTALSLGGMIKLNSVSGNQSFVLKGSWDANAYSYGILSSGAKIQYRWRIDAGTENILQTDNDVLTTNQWRHIFVTHIGGSTPSIYIDGILVAATITSGSGANAIVANENPFVIGAGATPSLFFNGSIDDVRIYNRALSSQEVTDLYNSAKATYISSATKTGLVGWWTMDRTDINGTTVLDKIGTNHLTAVVGAPTTAAGKINQAVDFDGTDLLLKNTVAAGLDFSNITQPFTISLWANIDDFSTAYDGLISSKTTGDDSWGIVRNLNNTYFFQYASSDVVLFSSGKSGQWQHYVATYDGADNIRVYLDGVAGNSGERTTTMVDNNRLCLGAYRCDDGMWRVNGKIDDVRIYNRALSAQEVANIYNSAKVMYISE